MEIKDFEILLNKSENEFLEFKSSFITDIIGDRISAIINSCIYKDENHGYILIGIDDDKKVIGTDFDHNKYKEGSSSIHGYLDQKLSPKISINFDYLSYKNKEVCIIKLQPTIFNQPVKYKGIPYIRIGEQTKQLKDFPEIERHIWTNENNKNIDKTILLKKI